MRGERVVERRRAVEAVVIALLRRDQDDAIRGSGSVRRRRASLHHLDGFDLVRGESGDSTDVGAVDADTRLSRPAGPGCLAVCTHHGSIHDDERTVGARGSLPATSTRTGLLSEQPGGRSDNEQRYVKQDSHGHLPECGRAWRVTGHRARALTSTSAWSAAARVPVFATATRSAIARRGGMARPAPR